MALGDCIASTVDEVNKFMYLKGAAFTIIRIILMFGWWWPAFSGIISQLLKMVKILANIDWFYSIAGGVDLSLYSFSWLVE